MERKEKKCRGNRIIGLEPVNSFGRVGHTMLIESDCYDDWGWSNKEMVVWGKLGGTVSKWIWRV